jgi:hypothetical protein
MNIIADSDSKTRVQKVIDNLYLTPQQQETQSVFKIYSFSEHMKKRADQIGDQNAYNFGSDINNAVLRDNGDKYEWRNQQDKKVRPTHRNTKKGLGGKTFLFSDPPTEMDRYGNKHTGNPGSAWGCRCYGVPSNKKPRLNFIARARPRNHIATI